MEEKEVATQYGVKTNFRLMPNGEARLGLVATDGSSYTRTVNQTGAWQNSHYHEKYQEVYIVQTGKVVLATYEANDELKLTVYQTGDYFVVPARQSHNIYQEAHAVTHNVKFGDSEPTDWHADEQLDRLIADVDVQTLV
ncbi:MULTISPECIES: cupin domain-containing protein [Weissella]|jgi:mannose-6-phosphate isomerase-like protein (cupin superfamily)|nr:MULTISPECIES: cupin domain-containing protein [Weissella]MBD9095104.1 hypothetical protein [Weissella confusa]APS26457.1 Cupin domain protein [Weissella cibaria]APU63960.1 Cupin domain protein [Weissella cibaria]APU66110.1 Cupin domain protein [Weissella cibaria]ASS52613.1 hypothetical protein CHR48_01698 [Weissella cibaria]